jgi:hypothetical protein
MGGIHGKLKMLGAFGVGVACGFWLCIWIHKTPEKKDTVSPPQTQTQPEAPKKPATAQ